MASFEQRISRDGTPVIRVRVRMKGFPTRTAQFPTLKAARKWAQITQGAMLEGRHLKTTDATKRMVSNLIDRYTQEILPYKAPLTTTYQGQQLRWWRSQIGHLLLSDLTPDHISEQMAVLATTLGNASVRRYLAVMNHALNAAVKKWQWLPENPMSRITKPPEPRGRVRFLNDDERESLFQACRQSRSPYLFTLTVLALSTGARKGELLGLAWDQVDLKRGVIHLQATKNGERRNLIVTGYALEVLTEYASQRRVDTDLVFPGRSGKKPVYVRDAFEAAVRRADVTDFCFHDLRHSAASYLAMNGASLAEIAAILGHKSLEAHAATLTSQRVILVKS